ncbi:MAG: DUF2975 domain-containing protein [Propionibacteriaceae bacterium]|jgi:hypothetical protein|nr:DUF2975 domain-containing protein [Propionibacteriaceae bacterium]
MTRHTGLLRALLAVLLLGLVVVAALLYLGAQEIARDYPEVAPYATPIWVAIVVGIGPTVLATATVFRLLSLADRGEAFSPKCLRLLAQMVKLFAGTAAYAVVLYVVCRLVLGDAQVHFLFTVGFVVVELVYLFLAVFIAFLRRLIADALALREEQELTV